MADKYKEYVVKNLEDALKILYDLIVNVTSHLLKYKEYSNELDKFIQECSEKSKEIVLAKQFEDFDDKIKYRQMMILKYIADEQKNSFSYKNLRKILKERKWIDYDLSEDVGEILNSLLLLRNTTFHNTHSVFSAADEVSKKGIPSKFENIISPSFIPNPVVIPIVDYYKLEHVLSLWLHIQRRLEMYEIILDNMKKDYEYLYKQTKPSGMQIINMSKIIDNKKVVYEILHDKRPVKALDPRFMHTQISMAMQKKKYDGSKECFDNLTFNVFDPDKKDD